MIDFNSEVYRALKAELEDAYPISEQYSDGKANNLVIKPSGLYNPVYSGMLVSLKTQVNLFIYKACDVSLIWSRYKIISIDEDYKRVSQELEAKGTIEYKKYVIEYATSFVLDNNCTVC